jgi:membrane protein
VPTKAQIVAVLKGTAEEWSKDNVSRLAAAVSYYALLSIAPLLLITVFVLGLVFGEESARVRVVSAISSVVGPQGTAAIETLAQSAHASDSSTLGTILGVAVALFGASGAFVELQASMNTIWDVPKRESPAALSYALDRLWSFVMVVSVSLLLLVSAVTSAVLSFVGEFFTHLLPGGQALWQIVNFGSSLALMSGVFAVMFRSLPDTDIRWTDVWLGSFITALLFVVGNLVLGVYLGKSGLTSSFGGAGSVVGFVVWVYYSVQIIFLGAELTEVYTRLLGSRSEATGGAPSSRPSRSGVRKQS